MRAMASNYSRTFEKMLLSNASAPRKAIVALIVPIVFSVIWQSRMWKHMPSSGDEPHYLMSVSSLARDFDLDLSNNYADRDYSAWMDWPVLPPQHPAIGKWAPPEHGIGFPIVAALPYRLLGLMGLRCLLILTSFAGAIFLAAAVAERAGPTTGALAGALLLACPTWQSHAGRTLPEVLAGSVLCVALWTAGRKLAVTTGLLSAFLLFLYPKYVCLAVAPAFIFGRNRRYLWTVSAAGAVVLVLNWILLRGHLELMSAQPALQFTGVWEKFWRAWFDGCHGIAILQPVVALAVFFRRRHLPLVGGFVAYALLYAITNAFPGESIPGRYYCAALPLLCWIAAEHRQAATILASGGVSLLVLSFTAVRAPWSYVSPYLPHYWPAASYAAGPWVAERAGDIGVVFCCLVAGIVAGRRLQRLQLPPEEIIKEPIAIGSPSRGKRRAASATR